MRQITLAGIAFALSTTAMATLAIAQSSTGGAAGQAGAPAAGAAQSGTAQPGTGQNPPAGQEPGADASSAQAQPGTDAQPNAQQPGSDAQAGSDTDAQPGAQPDAEAQAEPDAQAAPGTQPSDTASEPAAGDDSQATAAAGESPSTEELLAMADEDMRAVLDKLKELGAKPIHTLTVEEARNQPTPADAVAALMSETTASTTPESVTTEDITIPGAEGELNARVYTPSGGGGEPKPVIVYYHGGGWVIAGIDVYDASARALAEKTGAIVVSSTYRQAPEHPFPAAHEDAIAAYKWVVENVHEYNGDAERIAVAGESAGGNLAANVAIAAREQRLQEPVHQLLVYPVAGTDMTTPSYQENANALPLGKADMEWFVNKVVEVEDRQEAMQDERLNLVSRTELEGLPPATVVLAQIDPLRSEGEAYAQRLSAAGVETEVQTFEGATHEFFGMASVVQDAEDAQSFAAERLMASFDEAAAPAEGETAPTEEQAAPDGEMAPADEETAPAEQ